MSEVSNALLLNDSESDRINETKMSHQSLKRAPASNINYNTIPTHDNYGSGHGHSHGGHSGADHSDESDDEHEHEIEVKEHIPIKTKSKSNGHGHSHGGHGHSHGKPKAISPLASPRASPRACGGLGPKKRDAEATKKHQAEEDNLKARRKLWMVSVLCLLFMILEIIGGLIANSLAIMTDAAHLLSDLASFLISIFALWLATRAPTSRLSFGFHRAEILGALVSVIMIWLLTGVLIYEAIQRIRVPEKVDGKIMFFIALSGLGVNLLMGLILHQAGHSHSHGLGGGHGHSHGGASHDEEEEEDHGVDVEHGHSHGAATISSYQSDPSVPVIDPTHPKAANINVSAAFIHVLGDAIQSVGVMIAAGLIWWNPEYHLADPICTFVFSVLVLFTTTRLVKQSVGVLMEGAPDGIDPSRVEDALHTIDGVLEVHDLHVWSLSVGKPSLSVHLLTEDTNSSQFVLQQATIMLGKKFNIHHSTIQVEKKSDQISCNSHWDEEHDEQ